MSASPRAIVLRSTRLRPVPGAEWIRLHLADDAMALWAARQQATQDPDEPIPFWGMAWGGGLAIAHHLRDHPELVAGQRVLDLATGSGLCGIAAAMAGARSVKAVDIDPVAVAAVELNARANRVRVVADRADLLGAAPPDVDVILAGDCWYEQPFAERATGWLRRCWEDGIAVLLGDPGRRHLTHEGLVELAAYAVRTTDDLEDGDRRRAWVSTFSGHRVPDGSDVARSPTPK